MLGIRVTIIFPTQRHFPLRENFVYMHKRKMEDLYTVYCSSVVLTGIPLDCLLSVFSVLVWSIQTFLEDMTPEQRYSEYFMQLIIVLIPFTSHQKTNMAGITTVGLFSGRPWFVHNLILYGLIASFDSLSESDEGENT